jgi:hypothetical protein
MFARTSYFFKKIWSTNWNFDAVTKCPVVVVDKTNVEFLIPSIGLTEFSIVSVRYEELRVNYKVALVTLYFFVRCKKLPLAYLCALIWLSRPSQVLTFIDNSMLFHEASGYLPSIRFIAIQNGIRFPQSFDHRLPPNQKLQSELLCIGQNDVDGYEKNRISFRQITPVGSLRDSLYVAESSLTTSDPDLGVFDICLISMFDIRTPILPRGDSYQALVEYVARYIHTNPNLKLTIASRHSKEESPEEYAVEMQYYKHLFSGSDYLMCLNNKLYSTYRIIDLAKVNISFGSTASIEAMGRGRRSLVCQPLLVEELQLKVKKDWYLSGSTYNDFSNQVDKLLSMSDAEYSSKYQPDIEYFAGPRNARPTHVVLSDIIAEYRESSH